MGKKNEDIRENLGGDWSLELILININVYGVEEYEAVLYFQDKEFKKIQSTRIYNSKVEAYEHFIIKLIPEYIWKADAHLTGEYMDYTMMNSDSMIKAFVDRFLYDFADKLFFNSVIDILKVLIHYQIILPDEKAYGMKGKIDDYYKMVNKINKELISRLSSMGFTPDRMVSNTNDINKKLMTKHELCKNMVFCRYHWTPAYRTIYSAKLFSKISEGNFIRNLDYEPFKERHSVIWKSMENIFDLFKVVHEKVNEVYDDSKFTSASDNFNRLMERDHKKLINYWSVRKPTGYEKFIKEYGDEINKYNC